MCPSNVSCTNWVSYFVSLCWTRKESAWVAWNSPPKLTDALLKLACAPTKIPAHSMQAIDKFVILMYDQLSTCTDVKNARKKLFAKKSSVQRISPTRAALEQHIKRAVSHSLCFLLQVAEGGSKSMMVYTNHTGSHYQKHRKHALSWSRMAASKSVVAAASTCKKAPLKCTALCVCEGECYTTNLTMYHSFTQMACVYVSQLKYTVFIRIDAESE